MSPSSIPPAVAGRALRAPRVRAAVKSAGGDVIVKLKVVLEARRAIARRQTFDFFIGELAVRTLFRSWPMPSRRSMWLLQVVGAAQHARERAADLDDVFADRLFEQQSYKKKRSIRLGSG